MMPPDLQIELWRALVSSSLLVLMALVAFVVSVLTRMKREQDVRAKEQPHRDAQRREVHQAQRELLKRTERRTEPRPADEPGWCPERRALRKRPQDAPAPEIEPSVAQDGAVPVVSRFSDPDGGHF
jgi:C4-dicarboxylate-specific signal transduction histidine kinase